MPQQNRVTPFGDLIATPARGTLMGNRGCLHDSQGAIRRTYQGKRWIICVLAFKNRRRTIMAPGQYTELFFLDEATALAAGHRPCAECQRERFNLFRTVWTAANPHLVGGIKKTSATFIDAVLHEERLLAEKPTVTVDQLPTGSFVTLAGTDGAYLVRQGQLYHWTSLGYEKSSAAIPGTVARVLTPLSVVRMLAAGYEAGLHCSASAV